MIYIAGPFFNEQELLAIQEIESVCIAHELKHFSPRLEGGVLKDMTDEERKAASDSVYEMNVRGIEQSDCIIAIIDNFDPGTMFELGYAAAKQKRIITVSNNNYGLNVMLAKPAETHTYNAKDAIAAYLGHEYNKVEKEVTT